MIHTQTQLDIFLNSVKDETEFAIDTEFKRTNTYHPILCLVQIATKNAIDCIDVLNIQNLTPLFDKLYQPEVLWIAHSARQDIEAMYCLSGKLPKQLFDTQIAANLLNYPMQISYQALTEIFQNIHLEKAYTRLDWTTRPLPDAAVEYALDDVRYLLKIYHQLKAQLKTHNKLEWLQEEGESLSNINLYQVEAKNAWKKIKSFSRLNKKYHSFALQLAAWREQLASHKNKPRKWIMTDDKLINYAMNKDKLSINTKKKFDAFISNNPELQQITLNINNTPPTNAEKIKKKAIQKLIQSKANTYNLNAPVIANNKEIFRYVRGEKTVIFSQGWRYTLLKKELENAK